MAEGQPALMSSGSSGGTGGGSTSPVTWRAYGGVFAIALALFTATASRGAQWQDSGWLIWRAVTGELAHPHGLALVHPLHHWLARLALWPGFVEPCFAVTLISAAAAAIAVANTFGCVLTLTQSKAAALLTAGSLGVAHTFWKMATVAETYTLTSALLSAELWCLVLYASHRRPRWLGLMLMFNGLGVANHLLAALTTPVVVFVAARAFLRQEVRIQDSLVAFTLWAVASLPYTGLVLLELVRSGDVAGTLHSAFFGSSFSDNVLNTTLSARLLLIGFAFVVLNFPNLLLPAAAFGLARGGKTKMPSLVQRAMLAELVIYVCFVARYNIVDQYTFFLPIYVLLSIFGGVGFAAMLRSGHRRRGLAVATASLLLTPVIYAFVPPAARRFNVLTGVAHQKPYRDDYTYLFTPWSVAERSAERMSRRALEMAGPDGFIVIEDGMAEFAIRYRARRERKDQRTILREITAKQVRDAAAVAKRIVLVPHNAGSPRSDPPVGSWKRVGDLYILTTEDSGR